MLLPFAESFLCLLSSCCCFLLVGFITYHVNIVCYYKALLSSYLLLLFTYLCQPGREHTVHWLTPLGRYSVCRSNISMLVARGRFHAQFDNNYV